MTSETQANNYVAGSYTYDADGQRVRRKINGVETWQVYGMDGELLAEYATGAAPASPQKEYGYRNGQLLITADVTTGPPAPTFSDDFNDNSLDPAKWSVVAPTSPAVVSETGQRLQITLPPNTATYNGISSNATFDLTGKSVQVEVAQAVSQAGWCENFIQVVLDANNYYMIEVGTSMVFRSMTGGVNNQTVISYTPSAFPYWRIRHDQAANTINLETSSNGTAWTTRKTVTAGFSLTALRFYLYAGAWGTGNGSPGAAKYDNFQLVGNTPSTVVNIQWLVTDQLGTPRMIFDKTGALATVKRHDYLPFGEELFAGQGVRSTALGYSGDNVRQKFTLYERDGETGLDYAQARYYTSGQGRFTSADPLMASAHATSPQTWNRYAYVLNRPLNLIDPSGLSASSSSGGCAAEFHNCDENEDGTSIVNEAALPWPPKTHDAIIAAAFPALAQSWLEIIQEGSRKVDWDVLPSTFDPRLAWQHGMVPGSWVEELGLPEATEKARSYMIAWRDKLLNKSMNDFAQGNVRDSLLKFGIAMHPMMDIQSPAHQWRVYSIHPIAGVEVVSQISHAWEESGPPTKAQMKVMTNTLRYYLGRTVSREFYQSALSPSVGPGRH